MRPPCRCIGVLLFFLLFFVSHKALHKALMEMFNANTSKPISPTSGDGCAKALSWWLPTPSEEADELVESDWWEPALQVLRIDKIKRWTVQEKGLLSNVWEYFKNLFRNKQPANDAKPTVRKKTRTRIPESSRNIHLGYSGLCFFMFVMGWMWQSIRRSTSEITAMEMLSEQLNSQSTDLQKMLRLLQQIQERITEMEECLNAVGQPRPGTGKRAQKCMQMTFDDSSASSE